MALDSLGDEDGSALLCVTTLPYCCDTNRSGNWFPPDSEQPLDTSPNSTLLYQSWGDDQSIQLLSNDSDATVGGLYSCKVPDKDGVEQTLFVGIYSSFGEEGEAKRKTILSHYE